MCLFFEVAPCNWRETFCYCNMMYWMKVWCRIMIVSLKISLDRALRGDNFMYRRVIHSSITFCLLSTLVRIDDRLYCIALCKKSCAVLCFAMLFFAMMYFAVLCSDALRRSSVVYRVGNCDDLAVLSCTEY